MRFITLSNLSKMLYRGSKRIIENEEIINRINVFPVADNDTGSNLVSTFLGVKKALENKSFKTIEDLADTILENAFEDSRGNSGIMTASYLKGFLEKLKKKDRWTIKDFAIAARSGSNSARSAIQKAVRGTMLDVMEAFSDSLLLKRDNGSISNIFYESLKKVRHSLVKTEENLDILKRNHVVDAGALGFTNFVYGFYEGLSGRSLKLLGIEEKPRLKNQEITSEFPHEVILTLRNSLFKVEEIKEMFNSLGDSLDIMEMEQKVKIHIHTDKPEAVKETAHLTGRIVGIRIMDMRLKKRLNHEA